MKTTIEVNGEVIEIDLENLTEEEAKKYNINFNIPNREETKGTGWVITTHKIRSKFLRILFLLSLMAFFLCGYLIEGGWSWSWSLFFVTPIMSGFLDLFKKSKKQIFKTIMTFLIIGAFFACGFLLENAWRWCWVLFFLFPIVNITVE